MSCGNSSCDSNAYPSFIQTPKYPLPVDEVSQLGPPFPTNSWYQNAIGNNISDSDRFINTGLWYWIPTYDKKTIYLDYNRTANVVTVENFGNFAIQETPSQTILVGGAGTQLVTSQLRDYNAVLELTTSNGGRIIAYPLRGSPFANFIHMNANVLIEWPNQTIRTFETITGGFAVTTFGAFPSANVESMFLQSDGSYITKNLFLYQGVNRVPNGKVDITLKSSILNIRVRSFNLTLNINNPNSGNYPPGVTVIDTRPVSGFIIQPDPTSDQEVSTIDVNTMSSVATTVRSILVDFRWFIYTSATLTRVTNQDRIISSSRFNGLVQLASAGINSSQFTTIQNFYQSFIGNYVILAQTQGFSGGTDDEFWSYQVEIEKIGQNDLLLYLPNHWNELTITNAQRASGPTFLNYTYGTLTPYQITGSIEARFPRTTIPLVQDISGFNSTQLGMLRQRVILDARITTIDVELNPYSYGQQAATAGRVVLLARELGLETNSNVTGLLDRLIASLTKWFNGTNSENVVNGQGNKNIFQLQYESTWRGVIVPADALAKTRSDPTSYGNSFYNDHHFQYGYIIYAVYCAEQYNNTLSSNFPKQINNLICDVCNPNGQIFSTRLRHKDFYGGNSWATGIVNSINRQQESSGEAINCYYACYLLSRHLNLTATKNAAGVCLLLEIFSSINYAYLSAPGTRIGRFTTVNSIGILQFLGKSFTLDWSMQPNTFPGRAIGMYGIQSIPFTDIGFLHITPDWVRRIANSIATYAMTVDLINGLMLPNGTYTPIPSDQTLDGFNPETEGGYWGNVGMMILTVNSQVASNTQIEAMYRGLLSKQNTLGGGNTLIKHFDSYSNTLYWLMHFGKFRLLTETSTQICNLSSSDQLRIKLIGKNCHIIIIVHHDEQLDTHRLVIRISSKSKSIDSGDISICSIIQQKGTFEQRAEALGVSSTDLLRFAAIKLTLAKLSIGTISLATLTQRNHSSVINKIRNSQFSEFIQYIDEDFVQFFI